MKVLKKVVQFFKISWSISPGYILLIILQAAVSGAQVVANIVMPRFLIDELIGAREPKMLLIFGGAIVGANLIFAFITNILKRFAEVGRENVRERWNLALAKKIMNVEYSYLETPYYLDLKERAMFAVSNQGSTHRLIIAMAEVLRTLATLAGLLAVILTLGWVLLVILAVLIAIMLAVQGYFMKYQTVFMKSIIPINRRFGYYGGAAYNEKTHKDVRLYSLSDLIIDRVGGLNEQISEEFGGFRRRQGGLTGFNEIINNVLAVLANGYAGIRVISDMFGPRISIGAFTMYVSATVSFSVTVAQFGANLINVWQMLDYLEPFMEFMRLPEENENTGTVEFSGELESVRFENVSFKYPGSDSLILKNVSFEIKNSEKISIVGLNGAGKTTLIKLIARLYHPTEGKVLINDRDIFDYEYTSYMCAIAAVFQDYKLFNFSIGENISCKENGADKAQIEKYVAEVGLAGKIKELPDGLDSNFGKAYDEDGVEMSGGEAQKVAIARALYKDAELVILDEPTSALDPLAEAEIYANFNELAGAKTTIYISHRMSSSVFCDRILIIDGGEVAGFDTHQNLMKKTDGLYYKLFMSQAENYKN